MGDSESVLDAWAVTESMTTTVSPPVTLSHTDDTAPWAPCDASQDTIEDTPQDILHDTVSCDTVPRDQTCDLEAGADNITDGRQQLGTYEIPDGPDLLALSLYPIYSVFTTVPS